MKTMEQHSSRVQIWKKTVHGVSLGLAMADKPVVYCIPSGYESEHVNPWHGAILSLRVRSV